MLARGCTQAPCSCRRRPEQPRVVGSPGAACSRGSPPGPPSQSRPRSGAAPVRAPRAWRKAAPRGARAAPSPLRAERLLWGTRCPPCAAALLRLCSGPVGTARRHAPPSRCRELTPPRCPGGRRRRPRRWPRSCGRWEVAGAAPCSGGPSPRVAGSHSPGPCPGLAAPPAGRPGGG